MGHDEKYCRAFQLLQEKMMDTYLMKNYDQIQVERTQPQYQPVQYPQPQYQHNQYPQKHNTLCKGGGGNFRGRGQKLGGGFGR